LPTQSAAVRAGQHFQHAVLGAVEVALFVDQQAMRMCLPSAEVVGTGFSKPIRNIEYFLNVCIRGANKCCLFASYYSKSIWDLHIDVTNICVVVINFRCETRSLGEKPAE
jgi:hypothetical protein